MEQVWEERQEQTPAPRKWSQVRDGLRRETPSGPAGAEPAEA